ncbi:MAG: hypothetical protein PHO01_08205 [Desulfotomaculaceae bacterium]|nr:hypothetical protein [Desulfotomaculaceae bacterium]
MNTIPKAHNLIRIGTNLLTKKHILPNTMPGICMELERGINPLTGLPEKIHLQQELNKRTMENQKFSIIYVKLHKEKYQEKNDNDNANGNHIILFTSKVLSNVLNKYGGEKDFIAHVKCDVFIIVTEKERAVSLCELSIRHFDNLIIQTCNQLELRTRRNRADLPKQNPFIFMAIIELIGGEKPYIRNIISRAERLYYFKKSTHGSIFIHEPKTAIRCNFYK